jgi:hypothetical protein
VKAHIGIDCWTHSMPELFGVNEDGMPGRNMQRKLGTSRGSPRRSRTAKAMRISHQVVKSRCACERDGWGRVSDDGPGQYNLDRSEDPWGGGHPPSMAVHSVGLDLTLSRTIEFKLTCALKAVTNQTTTCVCREQA